MPYIIYRKSDLKPVSYSGTIPSDYLAVDEVTQNVIPNYGGVHDDYSFVKISDARESERAGKPFGWVLENGMPAGIELMFVSVDKDQITADGIDTATITITVENTNSTEDIEFYAEDGTLIATVSCINGSAELPITATTPGEIVITVKSVEKYGQSQVRIEAVEAV